MGAKNFNFVLKFSKMEGLVQVLHFRMKILLQTEDYRTIFR